MNIKILSEQLQKAEREFSSVNEEINEIQTELNTIKGEYGYSGWVRSEQEELLEELRERKVFLKSMVNALDNAVESVREYDNQVNSWEEYLEEKNNRL
jgi:uncharacterized protein HemX